MLPTNPANKLRLSAWVMSLTILLSLLAFSGSATPRPQCKQVETELRAPGRSIAKRVVSFKRLQHTRITIDFLLRSTMRSTSYVFAHHQTLTHIKLDRVITNRISFLKPDQNTDPVYTPRSAPNALALA